MARWLWNGSVIFTSLLLGGLLISCIPSHITPSSHSSAILSKEPNQQPHAIQPLSELTPPLKRQIDLLFTKVDILQAQVDALKSHIPTQPIEPSNAAKAHVLWQFALGQIKNKDYDTAIKHLENFFKQYPEDPRSIYTRHLLAQLYLLKANPEKAIPHFRAFLQKKPKHLEVKFQLGLAYYSKGDYKTARLIFQWIQRHAPPSVLEKIDPLFQKIVVNLSKPLL